MLFSVNVEIGSPFSQRPRAACLSRPFGDGGRTSGRGNGEWDGMSCVEWDVFPAHRAMCPCPSQSHNGRGRLKNGGFIVRSSVSAMVCAAVASSGSSCAVKAWFTEVRRPRDSGPWSRCETRITFMQRTEDQVRFDELCVYYNSHLELGGPMLRLTPLAPVRMKNKTLVLDVESIHLSEKGKGGIGDDKVGKKTTKRVDLYVSP
ncbi:uncharacterized protein BDZ83DRAFT_622 [Colletotrichum acutatum]|uniref:Uncharacterized protein n=1 Tax=Glomerella acutata TaxID=27357 RepID=A0AAD8XQ78_GLOAC|nr:uncharacterized protein BDZ83DRAFT_622 [Colletotrichum acutatum]KAK1731687.1 hypothetical protein BDZ83DRAFT_622 [Colletotrichum acutatum]